MKKLLLALLACAPGLVWAQSCAAPTPIQIVGPVNGISGAATGTIGLQLSYTISGNPQMEQSQIQVQITAGTLYVNGAALVCVPAGATVVANYALNNPPPIVGRLRFTRYWTIPASGGPYLVSAVECTAGAIGCVTTPAVAIAAGPAGATGPQGATGATGATGAAGATGVINVAQTDVTASRAIGSIFQNLTGGTMFVSIIIGNSSNSGLFSCLSDSSSSPAVIVSKTSLSGTFQPGALATCFFVVPNNFYYKATVPTSAALSKWFEWN
jgi:hypothetical protein